MKIKKNKHHYKSKKEKNQPEAVIPSTGGSSTTEWTKAKDTVNWEDRFAQRKGDTRKHHHTF